MSKALPNISFLQTYAPSLLAVAEQYGMGVIRRDESGNITRVTGLPYLCPLCIENGLVYQDQALYGNVEFSLDHFPPRSVGGRHVALVCKECNNTFGRTIDYSIAEYLAFQSFLHKRNVGSLPAKATFDGIPGKYKIELGWDNGQMVKTVPFRRYPLVLDWMKNFKEGSTFRFSIQVPGEGILHRALLKAAYLLCFNRWGYDFVLSETGNMIREILKDVKNDNLPVLEARNVTAGTDHSGIYFIKQPEEYRCFAVFFDIKLPGDSRFEKSFVPIPLLGGNCLEKFYQLRKLAGQERKLTLLTYNTDYVKKGEYWAYSKLSAKLK